MIDAKTFDGLKQIMLKVVERATGWITVLGPVKGPEPANQYCVIELRRQYKQPHEVSEYNEENGIYYERQRGESTLTFEVQARGEGAMATIDKVTSYIDSEARDVDLWPYVGSGGHDEVLNIDRYHQGKILQAAVVNIYINANLEKVNMPEWFNTLDITVKENNNIVATITVPDAEPNEGE
jgi:hypothetical protein